MTLFLLCDLIGLKTSICWNDYIPKLLHIAVINLDSNDKIICFHSRQIIINICLMFTSEDVSLVQVATTLLKNQASKIFFKTTSSKFFNQTLQGLVFWKNFVDDWLVGF